MPKDNTNWLSQLAERTVAPPRRETLEDLVESRPFFDSMARLDDLPQGVTLHTDVRLRERDGIVQTAEVYVPDGPGPFPLYVHLHGGGYCVSRARNDRYIGMQIASWGYTVVNPEYGLAPEHPFPWGVEDALYATRWAVRHAAEYNADPAGIVLEGMSAGAGLASAVVLASNGLDDGLDQGDLAGVDVEIAACVLYFGVLSFPLLLLDPGSNVGSAELWNRAYLGPHFTTKLRHPLVSPVYAPNLEVFPRTYLSCGIEDSLLGHTLEFTTALAKAGVRARLSVIEDADHGFDKLAERLPAAAGEIERVRAWLAAAVAEHERE